MAWLGGDFQWTEKHAYQSRTGNSHGKEKKRKQTAAGTRLHVAQVGQPALAPPRRTHIRFVRKARMWCKTFADNGKQKQEWSVSKP